MVVFCSSVFVQEYIYVNSRPVMKSPVIVICIILISCCLPAKGQEDTTNRVDNKKLHIILGGTAVAHGAGLVILSNT